MAIDVSEYQGTVDWPAVYGAGVRRAMIKWGEWSSSLGSYRQDPYAVRNVTGARKAGVQVGLYFFAHPSRSPTESASWFLRTAPLETGDLPPALDLEVMEGHDWVFLNAWKKEWFAPVDAHVGVKAIFYSYFSFWQQMVLYPDRPVWGADLRAGFVPPASWAVHQYSFTGTIPGISGAVDLDRFMWSPTAIP